MRSVSKRSALSSTSASTVSGSCRKATLSGASVPPSCSTKILRCQGVQSRISGTRARTAGLGAAASPGRSSSRSQVSSVTSAVTRRVSKPAPSTIALASGSEHRL
jgi:hypothetical protein